MGVDALAGDYPAISPYCYVGGNPVRVVDPGGRDTTIYVYFDPNNFYFNQGNNRKELLETLRIYYQKNNIPVQVVETALSYNAREFMLSETDQYLDYSQKDVFVYRYGADCISHSLSFLENGVTSGQYSMINLDSRGLKVYDELNMRRMANTGAHESIHGLLERAIKYCKEDIANHHLDEGGHEDTPLNLMSSGDMRNGKIPSEGLVDFATLKRNPDTQSFTKAELLLENHKIVIQQWIQNTLNR